MALLVDCCVPLLACKQCWGAREYSIASNYTVEQIRGRSLVSVFSNCTLLASKQWHGVGRDGVTRLG